MPFRPSQLAGPLSLVLLATHGPAVLAADGPDRLGEFAPDVVINRDGDSYDSHPSAVTTPSGDTWIAWHAYQEGRDQVMLRRVSAGGELGETRVISLGGTVHSPPQVVAVDEESIWVVWSTRRQSRWEVWAGHIHEGRRRPLLRLSDEGADAILPAATETADGDLIVTWTDCRDGQIRIRGTRYDVERASAHRITAVSSAEFESFRSTLVVDGAGSTWAFWDRYDGTRYGVAGRRIHPEVGPIEPISPDGLHCLSPTALSTENGLYVAWLQKQDVMGGPGVVSQWHTLHAAVRTDDDWQVVTDQDGSPVAAELTQGLVAMIDPQAVATGGYLGRRTAPMLLQHGEDVWLLWERKADHRGSTSDVVGDLLGCPIKGGVWQSPVLLQTGLLDYHMAHPRRADDDRFVLLASQLPRNNRRIYHRLVGNLEDTKPFVQDDWPGWRPVDLPVQAELTERQSIQAEGKTYQLYWADMHCHSGLTADAEGEQDELTHYARDRAKLDVVVFTNNDFLYDVPLTEYEYALGNFFAGLYSRPGEFLSLPGYEWTSRIPGVATADVSDPANWTKPYGNRSYPNHRSVIYLPKGGPVVRYPEVGNDVAALNEAVARAGGITLTQHDAFQPSGHPVEVGMELTSGWRNYIARVPDLFHDPLNQGARLGFVANGDSHRRAPGLSGALTGIYAERLTAESILDALRARRCFATNGSRIFIDARADGTLMGQETKISQRPVTLSLHSVGTRPIVSAVLVRDGQQIRTFRGNGSKTLRLEHADEDLSPGTHWYYWRISQERDAPPLPGNLMVAHGHLAWSTPNWVTSK